MTAIVGSDVDVQVAQATTNISRKPAHLRIVYAMPEMMVNHLSMIAERWKIDRWVIGRITAELIDWLEGSDGRLLLVATMDAYDAVAHVMQYEVSPRTVRLYCAAFRYFDAETVKVFDHLPYSRFVDAMSYGERSTEVLKWCDEFQGSNGSSPSSSLLREHFSTPLLPPETEPYYLEADAEDIAFIDGAENVDDQVTQYGEDEIATCTSELSDVRSRVEAFYFIPSEIRASFIEDVGLLEQRLAAMLVILHERES